MNNIIISALDEQFNKDCKVISTNSEYPSYTGIEKWIIITDLTEEELNIKYSEQVNPLRPFIILSRSFGKVRNKYIRNENKHRMRAVRTIEPFDYDDELLVAHHPEIIRDTFEDDYIFRQDCLLLQEAISRLNENQKKRLTQFFFEGKSYAEIGKEEGVTYQAVQLSVEGAIKKLRKILEKTLVV